MSIEKELLTENEEDALEKELQRARYGTVLREGELNQQARELIPKIARFRVYRLTMKKHREQIHKLREELMRDVKGAAGLQRNNATARAFREFFFKEITDRCKDLLDGNFLVRLNAVVVLTKLNVVPPDPGRDREAVPYVPAAEPLLTVVTSDDQPVPIKIVAVGRDDPRTGLQRILSYLRGAREIDLKHRIAHGLVDELKNKDTHFWYQQRLVQAIGASDLLLDRETREPFLFKALSSVLVDKERHWVARSEAARALGRLEANGDINFGLLAFEVVHLSHQMAEAYNKNPKAIYWRECFFNVYLAFRPLNDEERARRAGLVNKAATGKHQNLVNDAYRQVLPLAKHVLNASRGTPLANNLITPVNTWLQDNKPDDMRVAPNLQPLSNKHELSETAVAAESD